MSRLPVPDPGPAFAERFALARFEDGGVLLHVESGAYYRAEGPTAEALHALVRGASRGEAVATVARATGWAEPAAAAHVEALLRNLAGAGASDPGEPAGPTDLQVEPDGGEFLFRFDGTARLRVDRGAAAVRLACDAGSDRAATLWLQRACPHLLMLRGWAVLHGAAVLRDGRVTVLLGRGGAGKTTTARALADAAGEVAGEDLLVLDGQTPRVAVAAEAALRGRLPELGARLRRDRAVPLEGLDRSLPGPAAPVGELWLLDARRRSGGDIAATPLARAEAMAAALSLGFGAPPVPHVTRRLFHAYRAAVEIAPAFAVAVPDGLDRLRAAAARYSVVSRS